MSAGKVAADEFRDYCVELFSSLEPHAGIQGIATKRMFGGTGFSIDGKNFAIIAFDQLWLKADDQSRAEFVAAGCPIFTYAWTDGIARNLSYYNPPSEAMESGTAMRPWAALAWDAALRAAAPRAKKSRKKNTEK
jgi:DNA transformation protein and related proteins